MDKLPFPVIRRRHWLIAIIQDHVVVVVAMLHHVLVAGQVDVALITHHIFSVVVIICANALIVG